MPFLVCVICISFASCPLSCVSNPLFARWRKRAVNIQQADLSRDSIDIGGLQIRITHVRNDMCS